MKSENIEIIFDNGGGITIQNTEEPYYMHYYNNEKQVANDITDLLHGGDTADWEGNEYNEDDGLLNPTYDQIRNGGYRIFSLDEILSAVNNPNGDDDISWGNVIDVITALRSLIR